MQPIERVLTTLLLLQRMSADDTMPPSITFLLSVCQPLGARPQACCGSSWHRQQPCGQRSSAYLLRSYRYYPNSPEVVGTKSRTRATTIAQTHWPLPACRLPLGFPLSSRSLPPTGGACSSSQIIPCFWAHSRLGAASLRNNESTERTACYSGNSRLITQQRE